MEGMRMRGGSGWRGRRERRWRGRRGSEVSTRCMRLAEGPQSRLTFILLIASKACSGVDTFSHLTSCLHIQLRDCRLSQHIPAGSELDMSGCEPLHRLAIQRAAAIHHPGTPRKKS